MPKGLLPFLLLPFLLLITFLTVNTVTFMLQNIPAFCRENLKNAPKALKHYLFLRLIQHTTKKEDFH